MQEDKTSDKVQAMIDERSYASQGGTKLRLVYPVASQKDFNYMGAQGALRAALAPFGHFQTGVSITAPLFFPPVGNHGCSDLTLPEEIGENYNMHWRGFVIVLDGICTYEEKARRIEKMGAQAVIIAHDPKSIIGERFEHDSDSKYDGSGHAITIPTIIVDSTASKMLLELVRGEHNFDEKIVLKADIEISDQEDQTVSYSLYYGSLIDITPEFVAHMFEYQHALDKSAYFIPRILTFECPTCPVEIQQEHCVSSGRFCFTPPSQEKLDLYPKITTQQLIKENLRQRCVYEVMTNSPEEVDDLKVFNYLYNAHACLTVEGELTDNCAERTIRHLKLPLEDIDECIATSYEEDGNTTTENDLLRKDRISATDLGVQLNPTMAINGKIFHGDLNASEVFANICGAYKVQHQPLVCSNDFDISLALGHFEQDFIMPEGNRFHHLLLVIVVAIIFNIALFVWCKRRRQSQNDTAMQSQVQIQVEKYFRLQGSEM